MKVALIGATGFVGNAILKELIERGHTVTAIARDTSQIAAQNNVTAIKVDVMNEEELVAALKHHHAVISAYNAGWTNPNIYPDFLKGSASIQAGVKKSEVKRLIVVGGAGSLFVGDVQLVDTPDFPKEYKSAASAARDYLDILKEETTLDWTFLSPAIEMHQGTSGIRKGTYHTGLENPVFDANGKSVISVEDIAVAITDELEKPKHLKERFTVAY